MLKARFQYPPFNHINSTFHTLWFSTSLARPAQTTRALRPVAVWGNAVRGREGNVFFGVFFVCLLVGWSVIQPQ